MKREARFRFGFFHLSFIWDLSTSFDLLCGYSLKMSVQQQVHHKFRVFVGSSIGDVADKVRAFTADSSVAAKSIGIEYVEQTDQFLLSLGYAPGQEGYPVTVTEAIAGPLPQNDEADELCASLERAAANAGDVICHELYVDADAVVHMVFMARA